MRFLSLHDGTPMLLMPEHTISLQNSIGSDIIMQLDDVLVTKSPDRVPRRAGSARLMTLVDDVECGLSKACEKK